MISYATDWLAVGACLTADPDLFFPIATGAVGASQAAEAQRTATRAVLDRLRPSTGTPSDAAADAVLNVMEQA